MHFYYITDNAIVSLGESFIMRRVYKPLGPLGWLFLNHHKEQPQDNTIQLSNPLKEKPQTSTMPSRLRAFIRRWRARLSRRLKGKSSPEPAAPTETQPVPTQHGLYARSNQNIGGHSSEESGPSITEMSGSTPSVGPQRARLGRAHTF